MNIGKNVKIEPIEYASQGNAILGIRDSGKTYTATYVAEQLMDSNIPIIVFDPIGVWRYLKVGRDGNKGFPIVVAGEGGDLPLTVESAPDIVRAAMRENVSLVIDLYSMNLSKSDWKRIVEQCVRLLLYENKNCGLRHIFIEEACEFVPQRVGPDQGKVYAEMEKLARMGGNASLGYTLINQRAEEVNKAVLELCDCLFLHKQKGRHSLTALGKWLDVADTSNSKEIIKSLPSLNQGECWVWMQGSHKPVLVHMPEKRTVHPDRRNPLAIAKGIPVDSSLFIQKMKNFMRINALNLKENLGTGNKSAIEGRSSKKEATIKNQSQQQNNPVMESSNTIEINSLKEKIENLEKQLFEEKALRMDAEKKLEIVRTMLKPQYDQLTKIFSQAQVSQDTPANNDMWKVWLDKLNGKNRDMLQVIIDRKRVTRKQLALLIGMPSTSGTFSTYLSKINTMGLVKKEGDEFVLQTIN